VKLSQEDRLLVTGATGLVGSHVVERACEAGLRTRALVRPGSSVEFLQANVEQVAGDVTDRESLRRAVDGVTLIVHCAAKVGDWGPVDAYREVNVRGLEGLIEAAEAAGTLRRFIHVSSLGVYEARDHYGTDESEQPAAGIDGYTLTKVESEQLVARRMAEKQFPATILRPGFIYGPRDRTVLPRILERLRDRKFAFLGSGEKLMNNTYVGNLVDAIFAALENDNAIGQTYNVTDPRLVTKQEFISTIARAAGYPVPTKKVPLPVARLLARVMEGTWRMLGKREAPLLSGARIKFLGLNLDFNSDKARRELQLPPQVDFRDAMPATIEWFRRQEIV
jgi:2-alkyl-3-oxoalkanoate reductase